jgi:D-sedoheptulose 7-phosphate isomerase
MEVKVKKIIRKSLTEASEFLDVFIRCDQNLDQIANAAEQLITTLRNGKAIYSCGNGGSMSDAMHFAEELTGRYRDNRPGLSATAISDAGHISCVANDFGYEHIFSRYLQARARVGDCLLAISTSGKSKNVLKAAEYARDNQLTVISLTGTSDSPLGRIAHVDISAGPSAYADRIQEVHIKIIHILIELIEREFFPGNYS